MTDPLRPSTLGEILDRTANIYRGRFLVFLGISFLPAGAILSCAVATVLFFVWVGTQSNAAGPVAIGVASILFLVVGLLFFLPVCIGAAGLGAGAMNHAAAGAFEDQTVTIRGAYMSAWKRGWRYIGLLVLEGLILVVAPGIVWSLLIFVFAIGQLAAGKPSAGAGAAAGVIVLLLFAAMGLYALVMLLMLCLSFPACVVENVGAWTAVKRAFSLSKGTRGRLLVLYILGTVLHWGVSFVLMIPAILIVTLVPGLDTPQHARVIGSVMIVLIYGGSFLVRALTKPIYTIAQVLFYYDQRIRKEGYDIEWLMRQAGMVETSAPASDALPWMPPVSAWDGAPRSPAGVPEIDVATYATAADAPPSINPAAETLEPEQKARPGDLPPNTLPSAPGEPA